MPHACARLPVKVKDSSFGHAFAEEFWADTVSLPAALFPLPLCDGDGSGAWQVQASTVHFFFPNKSDHPHVRIFLAAAGECDKFSPD